MPLPEFKTKDEIPEAFRGEYVERDGKFVFDDKDVVGLKASQQRILEEKKAAEKETARLRSLHGDLSEDELAQLIKDRAKAEHDRALKAGDVEKLVEKRVNETKVEYDKRIAALEPFKQKYEDRELDIAIRDAASKAGVISEDMPHVLAIVKGNRVKLDPATNKMVVFDKDGDPTGITVEKFFAETFKAEAPKFYNASGAGGGGAGGGGGGGKGRTDGTIARGDNQGFLANVDKIAKGEVKVAS